MPKKQLIDIVFSLNDKSPWQNNEIRFALRSIAKHLKGYGLVWIIGIKPPWMKNVIHIHRPDIDNKNGAKNIWDKVMLACTQQALTDKFLKTDDDIFFLEDMDASKIPYYGFGTLYQKFIPMKPSNAYRVQMVNTYDALRMKGYETYYFDVHTPILYDKNLFPAATSQFDWNLHYSYGVKSIYANVAGHTPVHFIDLKLNDKEREEDYPGYFSGRKFISVGDPGLTDGFKRYLLKLFPEPSPWE